MPDDKEWNIDETIVFQNGKERLFYHLFISDNPSEINNTRAAFAKVKNILGISKTKAIAKIWLAGLFLLAEKEDLDLSLFDEKRMARLVKIQEIDNKKQESNELQRIRSSMNDEEWLEWCQETGHDATKYENQFSIQLPSKTDRIKAFLEEFLSSGHPMQTKEIKETMLQRGVIDGDLGWNHARVVAERMGLNRNTEHGYWQL